MAKLVTKFKYIKPGSGKNVGNYAAYIAKRTGVEKIDDSMKYARATAKQKKMIERLLRDFPDSVELIEYEDYSQNGSVENASDFIKQAIDTHYDEIADMKVYAKYISERPNVQKFGAHGLFTDEGEVVQLSKVQAELDQHEGKVWTAIISLRREDAERLSFNKGEAWRNLLRSHAADLGLSLHIPLNSLRWYAAFHNESHHPHAHLIVYSTIPSKGYLSKKGVEQLRSCYSKDIFRLDRENIYHRQTSTRNELKHVNSELIKQTVEQINSHTFENPKLAERLIELSERLAKTKGKKVYGYLSPSLKELVNSIVDIYAQDKRIQTLYDQWYKAKEEIISIYTSEMPERIPLSQNQEFKSIRNEVIREALNISRRIVSTEGTGGDEVMDDEAVNFEDTGAEPTKINAHEYLLSEAQNGNKYSQFSLGKGYLDPRSGSYNPQEGIRWLIRSAKNGYVPAMVCLGNEFLSGKNVQKDSEYALRWLEEAAQYRSDYAYYLLGKLYMNGEIVEQDNEIAQRYLHRSAKAGNQYAQYLLGKLLFNGDTIPKDIDSGIEYLMRSAEGGNQYAQYMLGKIFSDERYGLIDIETAKVCFERAYRQGNQFAAYQLAKLLLQERNAESALEAIKYLKFASEEGNSYANYLLGKIYLYGNYIPRNTELAMFYLTKSSEAGNTYATQLVDSIKSNSNWYTAIGSLRLLRYITNIIRNRIDDRDNKSLKVDKKLRRKIEEKKQAHGLKQG